jgi:hypothetical protein
VSGDDPAIILYTSGTTAFPKGVVQMHRNRPGTGISPARPALITVAQPPAGQGGGDLIEVDDPATVTPPDGQRACGQVEVSCLKVDQVGHGHGVNGDQGNCQPRRRAVGAVEEPGDTVGGFRESAHGTVPRVTASSVRALPAGVVIVLPPGQRVLAGEARR